MSVKIEVLLGSVTVVEGLGLAPGAGVECSVVLPSCRPAGGLRDAVLPLAQTLFAQGVSCEVIVVCDRAAGVCAHPVADLGFVQVVAAPGADRDQAVEDAMRVARGVWVSIVDDAEYVGADPYAVAECLHRARERTVDMFTAEGGVLVVPPR